MAPTSVEIAALPGARAKLARFAEHLAETHERQSRVMLALAGAASADPDAAAIWRKNVEERRQGMAMFARELVSTGELAAGHTVETVTDVLWLAMDVRNYDWLVRERDWPVERFRDWYVDTVSGALIHQATHDQLTGLANRWVLRDELDRRLAAGHAGAAAGSAAGRVRAGVLAVFYVDLDGFKQVNDAHGHDAGDAVLRAVSERLRHATRAGDTVARAGGDEFVVLCPGLPREQADALARRIDAAVAEPIPWAPHLLAIRASIGYSWLDLATGGDAPDRPDAEALLSASDRAMYRAKSSGGGVQAEDLTGPRSPVRERITTKSRESAP